jgi:hypothetical protein
MYLHPQRQIQGCDNVLRIVVLVGEQGQDLAIGIEAAKPSSAWCRERPGSERTCNDGMRSDASSIPISQYITKSKCGDDER